MLSHSGDQEYPIPDRSALTVTYCTEDQFVEQTLAALDRNPDGFAWVAAEAGPVTAIRKSDALAAIAKSKRYVATYWTQGKPSP